MDKFKSIWVLVTEALLTPQCTISRDACFSIECQGESEAHVLFGAKSWLGWKWCDAKNKAWARCVTPS